MTIPTAVLLFPPAWRAATTPPPSGGAAWWEAFQGHRDLYMAPQQRDWTCSVCAATWLLQATEIAPDAARDQVAYEIGYPGCVNEAVGLTNTQCLVDLFARYGVESRILWTDFDQTYALAQQTASCMSGQNWYHWVGVRGVSGEYLWVANSAPGYKGVWDLLSRQQFDALGPFKMVALVH